MLNQLNQGMPEDKLVMGNILRVERNNGNRAVMDLFDGSYLERWNRTSEINFPAQVEADAIAVSIQLMRESLAQGKFINLQTTPMTQKTEPETGEERLDYMARHVDFPLAVFLIIAEENAFFSYQLGVNANSVADDVWDSSYIDELYRPLGKPLSVLVKNGYVYTRSFEYVDVHLDLLAGEAVLTWRDAPISAD